MTGDKDGDVVLCGGSKERRREERREIKKRGKDGNGEGRQGGKERKGRGGKDGKKERREGEKEDEGRVRSKLHTSLILYVSWGKLPRIPFAFPKTHSGHSRGC